MRETSVVISENRTAVLPAAQVNFGPFRLLVGNQELDPAGPNPVEATFRVKVFGRSPAGGEAPALVELGSSSRTLRIDHVGTVTENLVVTVTLPGVFTAVQIVAEIEMFGSRKTETFPSTACADPVRDDACMLAAVNPIGFLAPNVFPLAIVYEPPGNCSFANLTNTDTAGVRVVLEQSTATTLNRLHDVKVLAGLIEESHT